MIDYQPSHSMRHCVCDSVADGFTYSETAKAYVHAACGKPRPTVQTNLHQLPAPVEAPNYLTQAQTPVPPALQAVVAADPADVGITPEQDAAFTELVQLGQEMEQQQPEPPAEQPKRKRGRPPKDTRGLALERRDAPDRWCVIREATGEIITSGLTSKAKATAAMDDLIRKASDDDSAGAPDLATAGALPDPVQPAPTGGASTDHVPAGAGQPAGPAVGGVRAAVAGGHPEDQAARGAEDVDQGRAEPTVPGPGGHGDQPEPDAAAEALPEGNPTGGPGPVEGTVPAGAPAVPQDHNVVEPGATLITIHGPQGDCPECFRLWDWCPASFDPLPPPSNPAAAEASLTTSGPGGLPASAVQPGTNGDPYAGTTYAGYSTDLSTAVDNPGDDLSPTIASDQVSTQSGTTLTLPGTVIDSSRPSLVAFMSAAKHVAQSGNTPWAAQYANELRQIVIDRANNSPRNLQRHLGPSEIGVPCDRQVVGKLVGFEKTNHVTDPWPSIMGTAGHAWMEETFRTHNDALGWQRWLVEQRVIPHPDHAGTSDLYDAATFSVVDWKFLGETSMAQLRSADGPGPQYFFQLLTYRRGYQLMGYRVDRIVIVGWPRTGSSADGMYAWEHVCTPEDDQKLDNLFARMEWRKQWAAAITAGNARLSDVPAVPNDHDCYLCPFYRPQSARDGGPGCPGHAGL